jgi:hypothetical protein
LHPVFQQYFRYVTALQFTDRPDYVYLKRLFTTAFAQNYESTTEPARFDWELLPPPPPTSSSTDSSTSFSVSSSATNDTSD